MEALYRKEKTSGIKQMLYELQKVSKIFLTEKDGYPNGHPSQRVRLSSMQILKNYR